MNDTEKPLIIITMGDAAGIGPEIILKSLEAYHLQSARIVIVGSYDIFERAGHVVKTSLSLKKLQNLSEANDQPMIANILDVTGLVAERVNFGEVSAISGEASVAAIRYAYQLSLEHKVRAIVSAPLHKQAIKAAGFEYNDECDLVAALTAAATPMMLLMSDKMRMTTLFPLHLPLKEACKNVTTQRVLESIEVLHGALVSFGISSPTIAVAALNPHAGEGGSLGAEEVQEIVPAIEAARRNNWTVKGPFPADSLFFRASKGEFDAVLTMYHDQGRIAMKTLDFGRIVIAMIGVKIPFLTVAHGTGHDIAGTGAANASNFIEVLRFSDAFGKF